jgi:hypothetical protein
MAIVAKVDSIRGIKDSTRAAVPTKAVAGSKGVVVSKAVGDTKVRVPMLLMADKTWVVPVEAMAME